MNWIWGRERDVLSWCPLCFNYWNPNRSCVTGTRTILSGVWQMRAVWIWMRSFLHTDALLSHNCHAAVISCSFMNWSHRVTRDAGRFEKQPVAQTLHSVTQACGWKRYQQNQMHNTLTQRNSCSSGICLHIFPQETHCKKIHHNLQKQGSECF